jgi:hypothetical protein
MVQLSRSSALFCCGQMQANARASSGPAIWGLRSQCESDRRAQERSADRGVRVLIPARVVRPRALQTSAAVTILEAVRSVGTKKYMECIL